MRKEYKSIVIGASFAGIGAAFALEGEVLLIEENPQICCEFVQCFDFGEGWELSGKSPLGSDIKNELYQREILTKDGVHLPAVLPVMYNRLNNADIDVLLATKIIEITRVSGGYELELFNISGGSTVFAERIIDSKGLKLLYSPQNADITHKCINSLLHIEGDDDITVFEVGEGKIIKGALCKEYCLKLPLNVEDDIIAARAKVHKLWQGRPAELASCKIAATALYFEIKNNQIPSVEEDSYYFLPSYVYPNPLAALDKGYELIRKDCL